MKTNKSVEISINEIEATVNLKHYTLVTSYINNELVVNIYSKGKLVEITKVSNSIIHNKQIRHRL